MNQQEAADKLAKARRIALLLADMPELETDADDVEQWTETYLYDWLETFCNYRWTGEVWEYDG